MELYEALKPTVGEEAARMIAEIFPAAENVATKDDVRSVVVSLKDDIAAVNDRVTRLEGNMNEGFARLEGRIEAVQSSLLKWMLGMFIPVWAGTWATVIAIVVKG